MPDTFDEGIPASFGLLVEELRQLKEPPTRRRQPTWPELKAYIERGGTYPLGPRDPWPFGFLP